jgi:hypothetical protein
MTYVRLEAGRVRALAAGVSISALCVNTVTGQLCVTALSGLSCAAALAARTTVRRDDPGRDSVPGSAVTC